MTKVNPNNENETKSDIFPWEILKSGFIFHWLQNIKYFNDYKSHIKLASFNFIVKLRANN